MLITDDHISDQKEAKDMLSHSHHYICMYVTGFTKMCIVHTSTLKIHKNENQFSMHIRQA